MLDNLYIMNQNYLDKWSPRKSSEILVRPMLRGLKTCMNDLEAQTRGNRTGAVAWVLEGKMKDAREAIKLLELLRSPVLRPRHRAVLQTVLG
jgi:hypothetical protein